MDQLIIKNKRMESSRPANFRLVQYPCGKTVLQGAFEWNEGYSFGSEWRDISTIKVNEKGEPI